MQVKVVGVIFHEFLTFQNSKEKNCTKHLLSTKNFNFFCVTDFLGITSKKQNKNTVYTYVIMMFHESHKYSDSYSYSKYIAQSYR